MTTEIVTFDNLLKLRNWLSIYSDGQLATILADDTMAYTLRIMKNTLTDGGHTLDFTILPKG